MISSSLNIFELKKKVYFNIYISQFNNKNEAGSVV